MEQKTYRFALMMLTFAFFMWGFLTCLNDVLVPDLKSIFTLSYADAMLVQLCFFGAYFIMSMPMAKLVAKIGYKPGMVVGFMIAGLGCLLFLPAAHMRVYGMFLLGLFVLASGIVLLQVAANPYATLLGRPELASRRLTLLQAFNSLGTTLAPMFGAMLILTVATKTSAQVSQLSASAFVHYQIETAHSIQAPYLALAILMVVMGLLIALVKLPNIKPETQTLNGQSLADRGSVWRYSHLMWGCLGIFVYVGAEVSIASLLVNYLEQGSIGNFTPNTAAKYVAYYWGGAMLGRFLGSYVLGKISPPKVLVTNAMVAMILLLLTVSTRGALAMWTVLAIGLFNSVMFPTIFSLAIRGLGKYTPTASGLLCMAIVGGAIVPLIQGNVADHFGLQISYLVPLVCYLFIVWYGWRGYDPQAGMVEVGQVH